MCICHCKFKLVLLSILFVYLTLVCICLFYVDFIQFFLPFYKRIFHYDTNLDWKSDWRDMAHVSAIPRGLLKFIIRFWYPFSEIVLEAKTQSRLCMLL